MGVFRLTVGTPAVVEDCKHLYWLLHEAGKAINIGTGIGQVDVTRLSFLGDHARVILSSLPDTLRVPSWLNATEVTM